jgi:hypothetical protein
MATSFSTLIEIRAPIDRIWDILTELRSWPRWNTTINRTDGEIKLDAKVTVYVTQDPGRAFPLRVVELLAPRRMVWAGGLPLGLFKGTRVFELSTASDGMATFSMREDYTGLLASVIGKSIPDLQPAFEEFARCLKREAESG